jgi:hypothetical protein
MCDSPFLISFENELPRYLGKVRPWQFKFGLNRLAFPQCRGLLALTNTACQLTKARLTQMGLQHVARKVSVFRGGVAKPNIARHAPGPEPYLRALFVGGNGFAKGPVPVVEAVDKLRKGGLDIRLTIVSHLSDPNP